MSGALETVTADGPVFRLARAPDPWAWPDWSQAGLDGTFGNRWDDSEGEYRVLYASSTRFGALLETLARFRPGLGVVAGLREIEGEDDALSAGTVPPEWFERRLMGVGELSGAYAEIGAAVSLATIRRNWPRRHSSMAWRMSTPPRSAPPPLAASRRRCRGSCTGIAPRRASRSPAFATALAPGDRYDPH